VEPDVRRKREAEPHPEVEAEASQHVELLPGEPRDPDGPSNVLHLPAGIPEEVDVGARAIELGRTVLIPVEPVVDERGGPEALGLAPGDEDRVAVELDVTGARAVERHDIRVGDLLAGGEVVVEVDDLHAGRDLLPQRPARVVSLDPGEVARPFLDEKGDVVAPAGQILAEPPHDALGAAISSHGELHGDVDEGDLHRGGC
jgi:hypothetical protein